MRRILFSVLLFAAWAAAQPLVYIDLAGTWRLSRGVESRERPFLLPWKEVPPFGTYWLRREVDIPASAATHDLVLTIGSCCEVYEVFLNGQRIGARGGRSYSGSFVARPESFTVPPGLVKPGERLAVALLVWRPGLNSEPFRLLDSVADEGPYVLGSSALRPFGAAAVVMRKRERMAVTALALGGAGLLVAILLGLAWIMERGRRELALAVGFLLARSLRELAMYFSFTQDWSHVVSVVSGPLSSAGVAFAALLAGQVSGVRWRWFPYLVWIPPLIHGVRNARVWIDDRVFGDYPLLSSAWRYSASALAMVTLGLLLVGWLKKSLNREKTVLAVALVLITLTGTPGWQGGDRLVRHQWSVNGFTWSTTELGSLALMLIIAVTLLRRLGADRLKKVRLEEELFAARLVQEALLSASTPGTPAFTVDAAYLPASEVGGDFYCALPAGPDGGLLVVVGDVSGKGLRAALLVTHVTGALSNERSRRPAEVLAHLNASLAGRVRGGFVTCCCVRLDPDGAVTIANAGHLAPYTDGCELAIEAGLPLGLDPEASYAESASSIGSGESLLLISDGVLEAANAKGELFGFDRTREVSTKSAQEIAEAARAWGQNDDITVVTVRRSA